jgi:hypothetical protein
MADSSEMTSAALTERTWADFEQVMGTNGGASGCWCMHWRLPYKQWEQGRGDGNRRQMHQRTLAAPPPGLVCYLDEDPVGWIGVGHRDEYPRMGRSPITRPIDDTEAWVISCIYLGRDHRHQRLQTPMISAACGFAAEQGQRAVDAYPVDPADGKRAGADNAMTGIASAYVAAGFTEIARPRPDRPVMRRFVD